MKNQFLKKIILDNSYSSLLLTEGSGTPIDDDAKYPMELPDWADEEKIKM